MSDPCEHLQCYLVGGAVRDTLLGLLESDRDWVVIGSSANEMRQRGFRAVGKDFPVFLHPRTGEEYALARRERKTGSGYTGFTTDSRADVTLEEDLFRRDLTINAIAQDADGTLIDPYGGAADLADGVLRHVSTAFVEDPLRVLRVARFAARYQNRGFTVAPETLDLMKDICHSGEIDALVAERVWQETCRALAEPAPAEFIRVLRACGALARVFPEINALEGVTQRADHHPEGDALIHTLMVLTAAATISDDTRVRFAALVHDLGKGATPKDQWPRHIKHEHRGVHLVKALCQRLGVPNDHRDLAILVTGQHLLMHRLDELRPETVLKLLNRLDAFRRPERIESFVLTCEADSRGRGNASKGPYVPAQLLNDYFNAARKIDLSDLANSNLDGTARRNEVERRRTEAISTVRANRTKAD